MRKSAVTSAFVCAALLLSSVSCAKKADFEERDGVCADLAVSVKLSRTGSSEDYSAASVIDDVFALSDSVSDTLLANKDGSDTYDFNKSVNAVIDADPYFIEALTVALDMSQATDGVYDPTIGALTALQSLSGGAVPNDEEVADALAHTGSEKIEIVGNTVRKSDTDLLLDFGDLPSGFIAQKAVEYMASAGADYGVISVGRTVGVFGEKPGGKDFRIGIYAPSDPDDAIGYISTQSGFVALCGDYTYSASQGGAAYSRYVDPVTGQPAASDLSLVAVLSQNGSAANAAATALFIMGKERGLEFYRSGALRFEAVFVSNDNSVSVTPGLEDMFELSSDKYTAVVENS